MSDVERHITSRLGLARIRLESRRAFRPLVLVVIAVAMGVAVTAYLLEHISKTLLQGSRTVRFTVSDATGVQAGLDEVRFKGIPAGEITGVARTPAGAVLTVEIQNRFGPIYRDATATLRPNTALEDMYLDISSRGARSAGVAEPNAPIPASQTTTPVNVAGVLDTFGSDERARLQALLDDLGNGLADHGAQLQDAFVQLVPFIRSAARITDVIAAQHVATSQLVHNMAVLTQALGRRTTELRQVVTDGNSITSVTAANASRITATLQQLAPTLQLLPGSLGSLDAALPSINRAARTLLPLSTRLPSALTQLDQISQAASPALAKLDPPVVKLAGTASALRPLSADLDHAVTALLPQTHTFDHVMQLIGECQAGINGFFQWNTSMTKYGDADGAFPRGNLAAGPASLGTKTGLEYPQTACDGGTAIGGRPPTDAELGITP